LQFCPGEGPAATAVAMTEFTNLQQMYALSQYCYFAACADGMQISTISVTTKSPDCLKLLQICHDLIPFCSYIKEEKFWDTTGADFPIKFDWERMTVTVDAGVPIRSLLTFMVNQRYVPPFPGLLSDTHLAMIAWYNGHSGPRVTSWSARAPAYHVSDSHGFLWKVPCWYLSKERNGWTTKIWKVIAICV
jgi:hypothetical protein